MTTVSNTHVQGLYHRLTVTLPAAQAEADAARGRRADASNNSDSEAWQRAWDKVREKAYREALEQSDLRVVSEPEFAWLSMAPEEDRVFTATVEVLPKVDLVGLKGLVIDRPVVEVSEDDVSHALELLREEHKTFRIVERPARPGDRVVFDYTGTLDGVAFEGSTVQGAAAVLGAGDVLDDMEVALVGRLGGETFAVPITFPDDYAKPDLRDRCAQFNIVVQTVAGFGLPEFGPAFVRRLGIASGSIDELREQLRERLDSECIQARKRYEHRQLTEALLDAVPVVVPETLLGHEVQRIRQTFQQDTTQDTPEEQMPEAPLEATAQRRVALSLILSELIRQRNIRLDEDRVDKKLDELAARYGQVDAVKSRYRADAQVMHNVRALVMEELGFEAALSMARKRPDPMSLGALLQTAEQTGG